MSTEVLPDMSLRYLQEWFAAILYHHLRVKSEPAAENSSGSGDTEEAPCVIETCLRIGTQIRPLDSLQIRITKKERCDRDNDITL